MDALAPGAMVGEYQIEGVLGEGGMGVVYAAIHPVIAKRAAVKVLKPELSVNRDMVERFVQEARAVNQIGHPNIIDIFAFGALADGRSYFVMERLRGESLGERLGRERLGVRDALAIADRIVDALAAAHDAGIVHRDLKPDNVFLVESKAALPQVKLLDFGIAKLMAPGPLAERTATGSMVGTPAYMSPEQARGQNVDYRTDIYALGAMLYAMLTGHLVFECASAAETIAAHLMTPPPPPSVYGPIAPQLEALVLAMLAKDPAARPSLARIGTDLARLGGDPSVTAMSGAPPRAAGPGMSSSSGWDAAETVPAMGALSSPSVVETVSRSQRRGTVARALTIGALGCALVIVGIAIAYVATDRESSAEAAEAGTQGGSAIVTMPATPPAPAPVAATATATPPTPTPTAAPTPPPTPAPVTEAKPSPAHVAPIKKSGSPVRSAAKGSGKSTPAVDPDAPM